MAALLSAAALANYLGVLLLRHRREWHWWTKQVMPSRQKMSLSSVAAMEVCRSTQCVVVYIPTYSPSLLSRCPLLLCTTGMHAASVLSQRLPPSHRVILIERNSHFNHLYVFPRFSTLPGHEHKAFIPYHSIFKDAPKRISTKKSMSGKRTVVDTHTVIQATVTSITPSHVVVQSNDMDAGAFGGDSSDKVWKTDNTSIPYSHLIYALGSHLPDPLRTEARTKEQGMTWMKEIQRRIRRSHEIVLVGGGALGVEFASDIKSVYPDKDVILIHSRRQLLPNFDEGVHKVALERLTELGVQVVLGERLALAEDCPHSSSQEIDEQTPTSQPSICMPGDARGEGFQAHKEGTCVGDGRKLVKTTSGKEFECDLLLLCTGQQPNSSLMAQIEPRSVDPGTRLIKVLRTLQVAIPSAGSGVGSSSVPPPFDPCADCDCFLDIKAQGGQQQDGKDSPAGAETTTAASPPAHLPNVYAIGDVADAFGALNAGYQAWNMADVAVNNIILDIEQQQQTAAGKHTKLQEFKPVGNMLKLSLGLGKMVFQGLADEGGDGRPTVQVKDDPTDLAIEGVWQFMANMNTEDMHL
jgi:NADH dehydrogenase FAD-containing subunit